jgi:mono/diheme cytochrome c family protein
MSDVPTKLGSLEDRELPQPPFGLIAVFLILVVGTWIPLVVFARARVTRADETRVHLIQDMDIQPRYGAQTSSQVFADQRSMRLPVPGTVARGELEDDDHYYRGFRRDGDKVVFYDSLPQQVTLDQSLLMRGQQRFNIYCATCHGTDGYGNGPINARAVQNKLSWVTPANLHSDPVRARPDGHLFNTITNGIRNMAGYGPQIPTQDRWAIVAYLRALQVSQRVPAANLTQEQQNSLK